MEHDEVHGDFSRRKVRARVGRINFHSLDYTVLRTACRLAGLALPFSGMLKPNSHIHFIGICGTAMASLAGLCKSLGYKVTGSDQNVYPPMSTQLADLGISIQQGYKKENL